jgi:hypothetical protein
MARRPVENDRLHFLTLQVDMQPMRYDRSAWLTQYLFHHC